MDQEKIKIIQKAKVNQRFLYIAIPGIPIGLIIKGILGNFIFWTGLVFLLVYILNILILRNEMAKADKEFAAKEKNQL